MGLWNVLNPKEQLYFPRLDIDDTIPTRLSKDEDLDYDDEGGRQSVMVVIMKF